MFRHFIYAIHISAMFNETIGVQTHDLCHQNGTICLSCGYQPRATGKIPHLEQLVNGWAQGMVDVQRRGGEGVWLMEQLVSDMQHRGGGGSWLLELGVAVDLGSWNSTPSSLQATAQHRGGSHREAADRMGGSGAEGARWPAVEVGRAAQGRDNTDDGTGTLAWVKSIGRHRGERRKNGLSM
jgi:hypothetical protein